MAPIHYQDFDLAIEVANDGYRVKVLRSPAGEAEANVQMPFSALELENFLLRIGHARRGVRQGGSPEVAATRAFGRRLFDAIFVGPVQDTLVRSLERVRLQGQGIRIRMRLGDAPSLIDYPWEYLYDSAEDRFLAHSVETPIVRYLELPQQLEPLLVQPPLHVAVMIASPRDCAELDVEAEWQQIERATRSLVERGQISLVRLPSPTLAELQNTLRRQTIHIFHFVGHGSFDSRGDEGVLLFEDDFGHSHAVSGLYLGTLLHDHAALRLALLNACEGARTGADDPFAGVAQQLLRAGIPAAIAMQFEITDVAAATLAGSFYSALADGYPVDAALTEARKALFLRGNDIEWGTPVLYMRTPNGQIFDVATTASAPLPARSATGDAQSVSRSAPISATPNQMWLTWARTVPLWGGGVLLLLVIVAIFVWGPWGGASGGNAVATLPPAPTTVAAPAATTADSQLGANPTAVQPAVTEPNLLYFHDFESGDADPWDDGADGLWIVADDGTGNHVYQGQATADAEAASDPPESGTMAFVADYTIQLRLRILKPGLAANDLPDTWLSFRDDLEGGTECAFYNLSFNTWEREVILSDSAQCAYNVLAVQPYSLEAGRWYTATVAAAGPTIRVTLDGKEIMLVEDTTSRRGTYYLNIDAGAIVQFDDIRVFAAK